MTPFFLKKTTEREFSERDTELCVINGILHQLDISDGLELLDTCRQVFHHLILVDYRLPERNLDIPSSVLGNVCEALGNHYVSYRRYMRFGAIEGYVAETGIHPVFRDGLFYGSVSLVHLY